MLRTNCQKVVELIVFKVHGRILYVRKLSYTLPSVKATQRKFR